ncbi:hypothetical protein [Methylocystis sp. S23]|jgi:uncharacterized membrane protein YeaQ/YmgE (transglycosylase-associated protein family)
MTATIDAALGASQYASFVHFLAFLIIGVIVGGLLAQPREICAWTFSLAMMGVCGAWLGAEFAHLFGQVESGGANQLIAASVGAWALVYVWRRMRRPAPSPDAGVAIQPPHA